LPEGYSLAPVAPKSEFVNDEPDESRTWIRRLFEPPVKQTRLSSNYSVVKVAVTVAQLLFACSTLYRTRGDQIEVFGYAAFGLTVVQYAWMSFINLIGHLVTPQYPTSFLVNSRSLDDLKEVINNQERTAEFPIHGAIGRLQPVSEKDQQRLHKSKEVKDSALLRLSLVVALVPLSIVGALSRFSKGGSRVHERVWTMLWLAFSTVYGATPLTQREMALSSIALIFCVYSTAAIGGFVVVGEMINRYGVCIRIK
jgi:hypothetical protein